MKKLIVGIIIGLVLAFTINIVGASISSTGVLYNSKTVKEALDDLYSKVDTNKIYRKYENGTAIYFNPETNSICSSSSAVSKTETKTGCMKWYTFNDSQDSSTVNMILDHNTTARVQYNSTGSNTSMKEVKEALTKDTSIWNKSLNARIITADEIATISGNTSFNGSTSTISSWFFLDSSNQIQTAKSKGASKYAWLFDYTYGCGSSGCNIEDTNIYSTYSDTSTGYTYGYWTSTPIFGSTNSVWRLNRDSTLGDFVVNNSNRGVRPVITISKSIIS